MDLTEDELNNLGEINMVTTPTSIFHITHIQNLYAILQASGLHSYRSLQSGGISYQNIAHQNIQSRRAKKVVPCCRGGTLHAYVPFYFAPRSPMLYVINQGGVSGYAQGQKPVVHLVSTAQAVHDADLPFTFTDGHGVMAFSTYFENLQDLDRIDWAIMSATFWNDTRDDNDRSRRRQAEFLVHEFFPWNLISEIGVYDVTMGRQVTALLRSASHVPIISVHRNWYY